MEYKNARLSECLPRHGVPIEGKTVKISTVNREIRCLLHALSLAADEGLIDTLPRVKLESEQHLARERVLADEEFSVLLAHSSKWLQRVCIGAYEACLNRGDLLNLTWESIGKNGLLRVKGGRLSPASSSG